MRRTCGPRLRQLTPSGPVPYNRASLVVGVDRDSRPVRVALHGEVDLASAAQLRAVLDEVLDDVTARQGDVVVDCGELSFIDACGLGVLAAASRRLQEVGRTLRLAGPSPFLRSVLRVTRLDTLVQVEPSSSLLPLSGRGTSCSTALQDQSAALKERIMMARDNRREQGATRVGNDSPRIVDRDVVDVQSRVAD